MAIDAGHTAMRVLRGAPLRTGRALILFVTLQASFGPSNRIAFFETENHSRFPTLGFQMAACGPVAGLAWVSAMHIIGEWLSICAVALHTEFIIIDIFSALKHWDLTFDLLIGYLLKEVIPSWPAWIQVWFCTPGHLMRWFAWRTSYSQKT
jgi:hypothetical protein